MISTYELPVDEIVSSGPERLIVFEGAEEKLVQLSVGLLERLGIGRAPWERDDESEYIMPVSTANQLPSGMQQPVQPLQERPPIVQERWTDDDWGEPEPISAEPMPQRQAEMAYREAPLEEEDNWPTQSTNPEPVDYNADIKEVTEDIWTDDEPEPYKAPPVNIPQKKKVTEYEEELDY
ncbi:MAG: hypothetical protein AAFO87_06335 [Cyanobacteria bacterium J06607_6]